MRTRQHPKHSRRGISIIWVLVIVAAACFLVLVFAAGLMLPALAKARASARQIKCATQTRNVVQGMTIFAQGNKDSYPLPSMLDVNNQTIASGGRAKDTSNNVLSVLCFTSMISPELLITPSESNGSVRPHTGYQVSNPTAAANPAKALWDPAMRCDFTTGVGHTSYAMLMASGDTSAEEADVAARGRLTRWSCTFNAEEAVFGNRGPLVTGVDPSGKIAINTSSNTLKIHGGRSTWEGNIAYNDNHVNFETTVAPPMIFYRAAGGKKRDIIFYDEPDDAAAVNAVLGIWVNAGTKPSEYKGVHD